MLRAPPGGTNAMNEDKATPKEDDVDRRVADYYASLDRETTPASLDKAVVRDARRALRADNRKGTLNAWFRPFAFATTVALCLAIVIDLRYLGVFDAPDASFEAVPTVTGAAEEDSTPVAAPSQATLNEIKREEKTAASASPSGERAGDVAEPRGARLMKPRTPDAAIQAAGEARAPTDSGACSGEQTATPARWWECILSLRDSGRHEAADLEVDRLTKQFPDFVPPD